MVIFDSTKGLWLFTNSLKTSSPNVSVVFGFKNKMPLVILPSLYLYNLPFKCSWFVQESITGRVARYPISGTGKSGFNQSFLVDRLWPTVYDPMHCSKTGFPVLYHLLEFPQTHVHLVDDAIQPSHRLLPSSPPALSPSKHQGLFLWVGSSRQVAKVLELQLQHQSLQWIFMIYFL